MNTISILGQGKGTLSCHLNSISSKFIVLYISRFEMTIMSDKNFNINETINICNLNIHTKNIFFNQFICIVSNKKSNGIMYEYILKYLHTDIELIDNILSMFSNIFLLSANYTKK